MDAFVIKGGKRLRGRVGIGGAKNATLPLMAAALLTDEPVTLHGVPLVADVRNMARLLGTLGCPAELPQAASAHGPASPPAGEDPSIQLHVSDPTQSVADYEIVRTMRASICVLGPLLAKRGKARVSMPGGCNIGDRPVDLHIRGLKALGAKIHLDEGYIVAECGRLQGARVFLGGSFGSTVLGTANLISAACLAEGTTVIESAACEPEIIDLANMLNAMGAKVSGAGSPRVTVEGVDRLHGTSHRVIPDRIEAGTYAVAAAITNGEVVLDHFPLDALTAVIDRLAEIGVEIEPLPPESSNPPESPESPRTPETQELSGPSEKSRAPQPDQPRHDPGVTSVRIASSRRLQPVQVVTQPFPGFPTDLQAQVMALLCLGRRQLDGHREDLPGSVPARGGVASYGGQPVP